MRGATELIRFRMAETIISIHAPREGSDSSIWRKKVDRLISIHAPREGSDDLEKGIDAYFAISIHAPREGSDRSMLLIIGTVG